PCPPAAACGRRLLLYLRLKGTPTHRLGVRGGSRGTAAEQARLYNLRWFAGAVMVGRWRTPVERSLLRCRSSPKPSPAVAGRPLRVSKGGGGGRRPTPGDMERKGLPAAAGPVRRRRNKAQRPP